MSKLIYYSHALFFPFQKRALKQKKYYPIDPGLRYSVVSTHGRDLGKSLELLVFLKLKQLYEQVYYWQEINKGQVDFVIKEGNSVTPFQVTWDEPKNRHLKALDYFYEAFPEANDAIIINCENAESFLKG